jgi:hypothetical protein
MPIGEAYKKMRGMRHDIGKLSDSAHTFFPMPAHERAKQRFQVFSVGLRYSADAHLYFFPLSREGQAEVNIYSSTLGNTKWMDESVAIVEAFIAWGKSEFACEVADSFEQIFHGEVLLEQALTAKPKGQY